MRRMAMLGAVLLLLMAPVFPAMPGSPESRRTARSLWELQRDIPWHVMVRGNPTVHEVALTFDDGPHPATTLRLLAILRHWCVPATFFVVGRQVDAHPELVAEILRQGHEVANHTYNHRRLVGLTDEEIAAELKDGSFAVARAAGLPTRLFRPPGGEYDDRVLAVAERLGYAMVLWDDDPGDWQRPSAQVLEARTLRRVDDGEIILLHDGIESTMEMLPDLICRLRARGFRFVTCSEMGRRPGVIEWGGPQVRSSSASAASR